MKNTYIVLPLSLLFTLVNASSHATTGYFMNAYGVKAQGNAGASIANFNDALTIAKNPAGLSWVGQRFDLGATVFSPDRSSEIIGNAAGANGEYSGNGRKYFVLPEVAYNHQINDEVNLGIAIYGNGGMNTGYKKNPFSAFGNNGTAGVNLSQIFFSPAVSWKYTDYQSIGIATNILYQQFEAKGISGFGSFSQDAEHLSNRGKDSATGIGVRLGWSGQFYEDRLTLGAHYSSKIKADKFDKYRGLFAEHGNFDVPESYGIGVALKATSKLTISADVERINYAEVTSIANKFDLNQIILGYPFGDKQGPGFGWGDIHVYKLGLSYQTTPKLTLRTGYSYNDQSVQNDQTFLNILAPGVVQQHLSVGATWQLDLHQDVSVAYTHALKKQVNGIDSIPAAFGGGEAKVKMSQDLLGLSYSYKY